MRTSFAARLCMGAAALRRGCAVGQTNLMSVTGICWFDTCPHLLVQARTCWFDNCPRLMVQALTLQTPYYLLKKDPADISVSDIGRAPKETLEWNGALPNCSQRGQVCVHGH